jgi:hypothetical protein
MSSWKMPVDAVLWLAAAFYVWQMVSEFTYDWKPLMTQAHNLPTSWSAFYITNAAILILGIGSVLVGWQLPEFSQLYPTLMVINIVFFHVVPTVIRRRFASKNNATLHNLLLYADKFILLRRVGALLLFLPAEIGIYSVVARAGVLTIPALIVSIMSGSVIIGYPILLLKTNEVNR